MSVRRWLVALALGLASFVVTGWAVSSAAPGQILPPLGVTTAGSADTTVPATVEETTTTVEATTTTEQETTTTPFEEQEEPVFEETTSTLLEATTTSSIPLLVEGPPVDPEVGVPATTSTTAAPVVAAATDDGQTGRQVALAVGGLLALAVTFAGLTWWYWRHTKPRVAPAGTR